MNKKEVIIKEDISIGRIKATSISKTKKITATIKNFIQKGSRVKPDGSKPHSKGEDFSLSTMVLKVKNDNKIRTSDTIKEIRLYKTEYFILAFRCLTFKVYRQLKRIIIKVRTTKDIGRKLFQAKYIN